MKKPVVDLGEYQINKNYLLGEGSAGSVYYGEHKTQGYKVAAKQININKLTPAIEKQIENEIKNLKKVSSPFIVKLYSCVRYENYLFMFLEYCEDGDLRDYLHRAKRKCGMCESEALLFMRHMIAGYKELNEKSIIHRDIKPANILLKQGVAKLSDFGFSRVIDDPNVEEKLTLLGTPLYTAPEILQGKNFCSKCDVWSMGVVFYEMLHVKTPWTGNDIENLLHNIVHRPLEFKDGLDIEIKMLISRMLKYDSKERISWPEVFDSKLFIQSPLVELPNKEIVDRSYEVCKNGFLEYLKCYLVKSYLRLSHGEVDFKESFDPNEKEKREAITYFTREITHRRNLSLFFSYVLSLYYRYKSQLPYQLNQYMEFEFALILRSYVNIKLIADYFQTNQDENTDKWNMFAKSSDHDELHKLLMADYNVIERLRKSIKKEAERRYRAKELPEITAHYFGLLDKDFNNGFVRIMTENYEVVKGSMEGVSALLKMYMEYIFDFKRLENNHHLDFGAFYENNEHDYRIAK